ncbi:MAG TPA: prepilin-type N-terminal cleavage/methylation domain-containing protein [candidate division Zixibacteria bacterium]|nr:prepilin-type N-terminal cleavage/methylation domain-containing protein [candidate division Zixibacteria bacterium]
MRREGKTRQAGFTLIELLVALAVLSIGMLGTASLTVSVIQGNFFSKNVTSATAIAQTQLEAVQNKGYTGTTTANFPAGAQTVTMDGMSFSRTTTITDNSPATNMKTVTVNVSWVEGNNVSRSITLQTILSQ